MLTGVESLLPTGTGLSHYQIIKQIGKGGMGVVYLAKDLTLHRKVAIKVLPESLSDNADRLSRFEQEAVAASALNHPNILTIHEIGESGGTHFIVSEFVNGHTLSERIDSLSLAESIDVAGQIASALEAAHRSGIVHRDIKPENIMIRDDGIVKVLDFGLAKLAETRVSLADAEADTRAQVNTQPGTLLGTVHYMSPEQARGQDVDSGTDIWSLGVVLFEMISGRLPFQGESDFDYIAAILKSEPQALKSVVPYIPDTLNDIVARAMEKDRSKRYRTSSEILQDLELLRRGRMARPDVLQESNSDRGNGAGTSPTELLPTTDNKPRFSSWHKTGIAAVALVLLLVFSATSYRMYSGNWLPAAIAPASQPEIRSLAILPLKSLDSGENYMGLGIADGIIRRISPTDALTVRPVSAVRRYLDEQTDAMAAANQLGVEAVLEGTIQTSGDRTRVNVNLLRVQDATSLWSDSFDVRSTDVFSVQDNVAQKIANTLKVKLDPAQRERLTKRYTSNAEAYSYFTKAMFHFGSVRADFVRHQDELATAIEQFEKAYAIDPDYALAYSQCAYAYAWKAVFLNGNKQDIDRAGELLRIAERIDPELPDVHVARSFMLYSWYEYWNVPAAIREIRMAQSLDPNAGHIELSELYFHLGLESQSLREKEIAMQIDPTDEGIKRSLVNELYLSMRPDEALEADRKYFGGGTNETYYLQKRMFKEAEDLIEEVAKSDPANLAVLDLRAALFASQGKHKKAQAVLRELIPRLKMRRDYHHFT